MGGKFLARPRSPLSAASDPRTVARRAPRSAGDRLDELPEAPEGLSEAAERAWGHVGGTAGDLGTVTVADLPALALLARCLGSEAEASAVLARDGLTITNGSGVTKAHPALTALGQARAQANRLLADFGMTPRGRNYVAALPAAEADDPLAKFFQPS